MRFIYFLLAGTEFYLHHKSRLEALRFSVSLEDGYIITFLIGKHCSYSVLGGGEMISDVFLDHSTYAEPPSRYVNLCSLCFDCVQYLDDFFGVLVYLLVRF